MKTFIKTCRWPILSGTVLAVTFPTWSLYPLAWVALVPLFACVAKATPRAAFGRFTLAGWVFNSILLQWLMTNVYWAGGWAFWGYQGLCLLLAVFWGVVGFLWCWTRGRAPRLGGAAMLVLAWMVMEFAQSRLFTGFGWAALGHSQGRDLPLLQWAALGGVSLVSGILVSVNALVALAVVERGKRAVIRCAAAILVIAISHAAGALLLGEADYDSIPLKVGILQTDFPLEMKWDREYTEDMVRVSAEKSGWLAERERPALMVWPEAVIMQDLASAKRIKTIVTSLAKESGCSLYAGAVRENPETGGHLNSSYLIDAEGNIAGHYDKVHLAPFGEYVPFSEYLPFLGKIVPSIGSVEAGTELTTLSAGGRTFGPLICFEVLFAELAEELLAKGADFLVVITNLGWFGASNAIPQEIEFARMRAIETRLPLVHSANTGISGVFDPWGRFEAVDIITGHGGSYGRLPEGLPKEAAIMQRCLGAFDVAAPGKRPIPYGPRVFPWLALGLLALSIGVASVPRKGPAA